MNSASSASLVLTPGAGFSELPQEQTADKKVLDEQLIEAVQAGDAEKTRALLKSGANADCESGRPLWVAINNNDMTIARILIEAGAQVNRGPMDPPLMTAAVADHVEMVRLLLSLGAKVNGAGPGQSALWSALVMNRLDVAKALIAAGADVKAEKAYVESHHMPQIVKALEKALGPAAPPMAAEQVVSTLEAASDSMVLGESQKEGDQPTGDDVARTVAELSARLKTEPQDTKALLLWTRFVLVPYPFKLATGYKPPAVETESLRADAALDRVLAAEPHNAEALYLKSRIQNDSGKAATLLRQAVEFAPGNLKYREFLALFLADQGHPGEAKDILLAVRKNHPMVPLLEDLESLSAPEGGELLDGNALSMAMMIALGDSGRADHMHLRLRTYHYWKSPAEIEAFFARRFPGFRFIPDNEEDTPGSEDKFGRSWLQFLQVKSGSMKPVRRREEMPKDVRAANGVMVSLFEINDDPDLKRKLLPGEHSCYLIFTNFRK